MKRLLIILTAIIVVLTVGVVYMNFSTFELYADAEHASYDQVFDESLPTVYYYYQDNCGYCNSIKTQVTDFYEAAEANGKVQVKLINMTYSENADAWYDFDSLEETYGSDATPADDPYYIRDPKLMVDVDDIKITGTPGMIYVVDGEVVGYGMGIDSFEIMESVNTEFDLGVELDSSVYGE